MLILGFDLETTGLDWVGGHRIIEMAMVIRHNAITRGSFVQRFNPQRPIEPKAQAVHGITFEDVSACPTFESFAAQISRIMNGAELLVAHNGQGFDLPFVNNELRLAGVPEIHVPIIDTMLEARWATWNGKFPNLAELCFALGIAYDPTKAHGALYDAEVMLAAFERAQSKGFFTIPAREERLAA